MAGDSHLEPLEVLYEADGLAAADLPPELTRLYGGPLGFDEPRLFANFVSTIDGVVAIPSIPKSNAVIAAGSKGDHFVMGLLRAFADVVLIGSGTLRSSPEGTWLPEKVFPPAAAAFAGLRHARDRPEKPEVAVLTGRGSIDPAHPLLESGALVLTSERGAARLGGELPPASAIVSLGEDTSIDPHAVVSALHERGHRLILSEAGPHTFGDLLGAGVVDELFLTVSPLLAGNAGQDSRFRLVEAEDLNPLARARTLSIRRHEEHVFLRYELDRGA
ncbi:MAG: dihydrofolate reductase family protein [Actinobacteria bacterium]|nr:dihydrofolate reductase family protein [Actinomycetota bacterium]